MREVTVNKATRTKLKNIPSLSMRQITEEWNETVRQKQADPGNSSKSLDSWTSVEWPPASEKENSGEADN